jgi:hypothetical protein
MQRAKFFEAAGQFLNWQSSLSIATDNALRFGEDMLCGKLESVPGLPPLPSILLMELKAIGDRIEEVMYAYDSLCDAAGGVPRFELALLLLDASPRVQSDVALRLYGLPAVPSQPSEFPEGDEP